MDLNRTINKVVNKSTRSHDETLLDLTNDTVQEENLLLNETAHDREGDPVTGNMVPITDYEQLTGKPKINNVELTGNKTSSDLSLVGTAEKGQINGVASLNESGKVPSDQLPSFVDDTIEGYLYEGAFYEDAEHTELITGESGKIYVDLVSNHSYRWSGNAYVDITDPDVENSIVHSITDSQDSYPVPTNGETVKVIIGKIKKYLSDLKTDKLDKTGEGKDVIVTYANEGTDSEITSGTKLSKIIAQIAYKFANYKFGHTIKNSSGTAVTQRGVLKFEGGLSVTDDSVNEQTIIDGSGKLDNSNVSTVEDTLTASKNYSSGDPFIYGGQLYKAIDDISSGGTIILSGASANATETTIEELITEGVVSGVSGVKGNEESSYRDGNVNLTPANIGAVKSNAGEAGNTVVTFTEASTDAALTSGSSLKTLMGLIKYKFNHITGGGHTIVDPSGSSMTQRSKLKFMGATVSDDSTNNQTIVTCKGGHTVVDSSNTSMTQRDKLKFTDLSVTDDSTNNQTIVNASGKLNIANVTTVQTTLTASKAYAVNDPFIYNGQLYKATSEISSGGTITIGTNASATTIEELINLHSSSGAVTGVKGNSESTYRTGNVNITPANVGAVPTSNIKNTYQSSPTANTEVYDAAYINNLAGCEAVQITTSGWSSGTTSVAGKSCYYKSITLSKAVYGIPEVKLKPANGTPTASEESMFNCLDYYGVDSASPNTLKVYAVTKPTSSFYIWVIRNGGRV